MKSCVIGPTDGGKSPRRVLARKLGRPIRQGYECCHNCDVPNCIEPEHLWEGTHKQNIQDALAKGRMKGWMTPKLSNFCAYGHELTPENTYTRFGRARYCKICKREKLRQWRKSRQVA